VKSGAELWPPLLQTVDIVELRQDAGSTNPALSHSGFIAFRLLLGKLQDGEDFVEAGWGIGQDSMSFDAIVWRFFFRG